MAVASRSERRVFQWRVRPHTLPSAASDAGKSATLEEIICLLEGEFTAGKARVFLSEGGQLLEDNDTNRNDKNQIYIADIKRDPPYNCITVLINRGDPNAASPAFVDPTENAVRVEHPTKKESPGWSAHLVISDRLEGGRHRACFEQMPRVSSSLALAALDKMVARALEKNPTYTYETSERDKSQKGSKRKIVHKPYRPVLRADRVASESLNEDLDTGALSSLTLTKKSTFFGGVGVYNSIKRQEIKVVVSFKPVSKQSLTEVIAGVLAQAKEENFETVTFSVDDLPGNQTSSPTIPLDDQDAMEHLYVRAKRITDFATFLEQCYSKCYVHIQRKMIDIINNDADW